MGRPLNRRNFGDTSESGAQIQLTAVLDGSVGAELCWVESQNGSRTYTVVAVADSSRTGRVRLQEDTPVNVGEARLDVKPSNGAGGASTTEYAKYLQTHVVKTWEGNTYEWLLGESVANLNEGQAEVQFA